ncbi:PVC-type heme-binding CxxCH protein [Horticoccus sp. 23ND18S-11]|uniref:PVC-type heme-binding CxxCH protein n=1 Tax=Horticoccus sp. 23ND18S-11 TaxID=3391832 RepID=UPI0039C9F4BC
MRLTLLLCLLFPLALRCAATPIRVLYLGTEDRTPRMNAHALMRDLGRDAIWFDYLSNPKDATPAFVAKFDVVVLDAPAADFPFLANVPAKKILQAAALGNAASDAFALTAKPQLLAAAGPDRVSAWEKFLAQRDPETREAKPTIANYEKRPQPITLQHPFSVKGSTERTQVAPDLRLELFAAEPDISKPIFMAWDERGRLWIAETRDYPHDVKPDGMGNDSIKICEDTNGDGRADKFTVFADHLNIPTGFVFANGGIVVAQSPRFLFLKDTNGDDKADVRTEIMTGWGINDTHAQANNLHYGYDNWLYGAVGYSGFRGTVGGEEKQFAQGTYRFKADGSALEFLHQFTNNTWGHSANAFGDQFGGTANNAPIFFGGIPATMAPKGTRAMTAKRINTEDKTHTITPNFRQVDVMGGYTAAAGSAFIYSDRLPARLQGRAMICEPTMKNIALFDVQRDGAGYVAKDGFNLVASSDEWMSPVFAEVGPDGAVWFADWQNYIIQHNPTPNPDRGGYAAKTGVGGAHENPLRDHARGRVYRVVWDQAKPATITSLKGASTAQLVAALGDATQFWRLTAQRLLVEGKRTDAAPALKQAVAGSDPIKAIHALWSLHGLGQLDDATQRIGLLHADAAVRRNATRALGRDAAAVALFFASAVVSDPDPLTRLAALVKLAEFPATPQIKSVVVSLVRNPANQKDEWLREASRLLAKLHGASLFREGPNLLPNSGFETIGSNGLPEGWKRRDYGTREGNATAEWKIVDGEKDFHGGKQALRVITRADADTSLHADVPLKPNTQYRLAGWVKTHAFSGRASLNIHGPRIETEILRRRDSDWTEVEVEFNSGALTTASVNVLHVARGDAYFDDVRLTELIVIDDTTKLIAADPKRGEQLFLKHPAACVLCHALKGQGSTVGPALDGIASRATPAYIRESLLEPSKAIAKGYEQFKISPMPPMADIFSPQELSDIEAFLLTLK